MQTVARERIRSDAGKVQGAGPRHDGLEQVKSEFSASAVVRARKLHRVGEITIRPGGAIWHQPQGVDSNNYVESQLGAYSHGVGRMTTAAPVERGAAHDAFGSGTGVAPPVERPWRRRWRRIGGVDAGAPALGGANAKIPTAGAGAHAAAALRAAPKAALDPGAAVAAALMTKLPPVRFMRKLFHGLQAGLVKCYTAVCG